MTCCGRCKICRPEWEELEADRDRLAALIANSHLEEVPATRVDMSGGAPRVVSAGSMLVPEGQMEREKELTNLLRERAKQSRENARLAARVAELEAKCHDSDEAIRSAIMRQYPELLGAASDRDKLAARVGELEREVVRLRHDPMADSRAVIEEWRAKAESAWGLAEATNQDRDAVRAELERAKLQAEIDQRKIGEWRLAAEMAAEMAAEYITDDHDDPDARNAGQIRRFRMAMAKAGGR